MTRRHEDFVKRLFSEYFALELRKIPETTEPTPDFGAYASGVQIAVLEVKALEATAPFATAEELARDKLIAGALRPDNFAGRVATKIHEAIRQLENAELPKVLVLLNDWSGADKYDLQEALQGYLRYEDEKLSTLRLAALERMRRDRAKIDLYLWIDRVSDEGPQLLAANSTGQALRLRYFDARRPI